MAAPDGRRARGHGVLTAIQHFVFGFKRTGFRGFRVEGVLTAVRARLQCTIWVFCTNGNCGNGLSQGACQLKTSNGNIINQDSSGAPRNWRGPCK